MKLKKEIGNVVALGKPGDLVIAGASTGQGKTEFAVAQALRMLHKNHSVLYFSTEQPSGEVMRRFIRTQTPETYEKLENMSVLMPNEIEELTLASKFLEESKLVVKDYLGGDFEDIAQEVRQAAINDNELELVVLDHLHFAKDKDDDTSSVVNEFTKRLKDLAIEFNIKILVIVQLMNGASYEEGQLENMIKKNKLEHNADILVVIEDGKVVLNR